MIDYTFMQRKLNKIVDKYGIEGALTYTDYCSDSVYLREKHDFDMIDAVNELHWSYQADPIMY